MTNRNNYWDWLKLFSALLMILSHIRFVYPHPYQESLIILGRLCFPIFGIIASYNYFRTDNKKRYLTNLLPYAVLSEPFYFLLTGHFGNVILQILMAFSFITYKKPSFALCSCFCAYGPLGFAALILWYNKHPNIGGYISNPSPYHLYSFAASFLPSLPISLPPLPPILRRFGDIYLFHLLIFSSLKLLA